MKRITIDFPVHIDEYGNPRMRDSGIVNADGNPIMIYDLDLAAQQEVAAIYKTFEEVKSDIVARIARLSGLEIPPLP